MIDTHDPDCNCSYCGTDGIPGWMHYGLNIPKTKSATAWWVIKYGPKRYIRWTHSWFRRLMWRQGLL